MPEVPESETAPRRGPTGLVDPRAIHPGPDDARPEPLPEGSPGEEEPSPPDVAAPPLKSDAEGGPKAGIVDPRGHLPGPDLGP